MSAEHTSERLIGLGAPEAARRDRVHVAVWDTSPVQQLGVAAFTVTEARSMAQKLLDAAERADVDRFPSDKLTVRGWGEGLKGYDQS